MLSEGSIIMIKKELLLIICAFVTAATLSAGYVDTIKSRVFIKYNDPGRFLFALNGGGSMNLPSVHGGYAKPQVFAAATLRPFSRLAIDVKAQHQFNQFWKNQDLKDTRSFEASASMYLTQKTLRKLKVFTAGSKKYNYDFFTPVKVRWNTGIIAGFNKGSDVANSGLDEHSGLSFTNEETGVTELKERIAVPFAYEEVSAGFVVSTSSRFKIDVTLPDGKIKTRRMKTYTQFSIQAVYGTKYDMVSSISVRENPRSNVATPYTVNPGKINPWGFKLAGSFSRKLITLKVETGLKPGIHQRFSGVENASVADRSYMSIGVGIGWM